MSHDFIMAVQNEVDSACVLPPLNILCTMVKLDVNLKLHNIIIMPKWKFLNLTCN